jgi:drug/metabolite transporter (DMT)-like permease
MNKATVTRFLLQAAVWGSSFTLIKLALEGLAPGQIVLSRLVLGALVLVALAGAQRVTLKMSWTRWGHVAVAAVFGNVAPYLLLTYGERSTGAGIAGVLVAGTPLLTLLVATVVLQEEHHDRRRVLGFLLGFAGVVLVIAPWHDQLGSTPARIACFGAAVSYAAGYVYVRKFLSGQGIQPLTLATNQLVAASAIIAAALPFLGWRTPDVSIKVLLSVVLLGVLSTGFANILYFRLIEDVGASTAAAVDYVVPLFAVLFSVLILGEQLTWNVIAGGLVVILGMGLAEGRLRSSTTRSNDGGPGQDTLADPSVAAGPVGESVPTGPVTTGKGWS